MFQQMIETLADATAGGRRQAVTAEGLMQETADRFTAPTGDERRLVELEMPEDEELSPLPAGIDDGSGVDFPDGIEGDEAAELVDQKASGAGAQLVANAKKYLGTPYVWGGTTPNGLDCSGLLQLAAKEMGISLPRVSRDQAKAGRSAGFDPEGWQSGDLIAFDAGGPKGVVNHIGMLVGRNDKGQWLMLHAPRRGKNVEIVPMTRSDIMAVRRVVESSGSSPSAPAAPAPPAAPASPLPPATSPRTPVPNVR